VQNGSKTVIFPTKYIYIGFAYKITDKRAVHFVTATVEQWIDIFARARDFFWIKGMIGLSYFE
jgi:hypothetical protein